MLLAVVKTLILGILDPIPRIWLPARPFLALSVWKYIISAYEKYTNTSKQNITAFMYDNDDHALIGAVVISFYANLFFVKGSVEIFGVGAEDENLDLK